MNSNKTSVPIKIQDVLVMAEKVAKSKLFPGIETPEQAFTLMMLCQAEGIHPAMALRKYHIIENRPAMKADAMLAEFNQRGGRCNWIKLTDTEVTAEFIHPNGSKATITWTIEMAKKIKYKWDPKARRWLTLADKPNWQNYPRQMLRARVISEGIRTVMPEACMGIYTVEEVMDFEETKGPEEEATVEMEMEKKEPELIPLPSSPSSNIITPAQRKRLYAIATEVGLTHEEAKEIIARFGYSSSKEILRKDYDAICEAIQKAQKKEKREKEEKSIPQDCPKNPLECEHSIWKEIEGGKLICLCLQLGNDVECPFESREVKEDGKEDNGN